MLGKYYSNNSGSLGKDFLQLYGTAMGPHNACSYADLAMGEIDDKANKCYATKDPADI